MSNLGLLLCLSLLAFGVAAAGGSLVTWLSARLLAERLELLPPSRRARAYLRLRLAPAAVALLFTTVLFMPAFVIFEPGDASEVVVPELALLALLAALPFARGLRHGRDAWWATRAAKRACLAEGEPVALPGWSGCPAYVVGGDYPVVAVVGLRRPILVVSRFVLETCSRDELAAILVHEKAHLRSRDNFKRLLLRITPDFLFLTRTAATLETRWEQAAEETADVRAGRARALDLASALIKVARLVPNPARAPRTVAALCEGGDIARRVRRLTAEPAEHVEGSDDAAATGGVPALMCVAGLLLAVSGGVLRHIHAVTELLVAALQ